MMLGLRWVIAIGALLLIGGDCFAQQNKNDQAARFQKELRKRVSRDQSVRIALNKFLARAKKDDSAEFDQKKYDKLAKKASDTDNENLAWLKKIHADHGFPKGEQVDEKTAERFFLLVLHADRAPEFQRKFLKHVKVEANGWPSRYGDLLEKRLRLVQGNRKADK